MAFEPLAAVVAGLIDGNRQPANANRTKAIDSVIDQRTPSDLNHWLADAYAVRAQALSLACGNDAALQRRMCGCPVHCINFVTSRRSVTAGSVCRSLCLAWTSRDANQMKRMPVG